GRRAILLCAGEVLAEKDHEDFRVAAHDPDAARESRGDIGLVRAFPEDLLEVAELEENVAQPGLSGRGLFRGGVRNHRLVYVPKEQFMETARHHSSPGASACTPIWRSAR